MKVTMQGSISECFLLVYRTPAEFVGDWIPANFRLLTKSGWAFWNIVICKVDAMRPLGLPKLCGMDYYHVAYRLYVSVTLENGNVLDGLYFVRSDADNRLLRGTGNWLSDFKFHPARISLDENMDRFSFKVRSSDGLGNAEGILLPKEKDLELSLGSPFESVEEACTFLKYRPLGLSPKTKGRGVKLAEVFRDESLWNERLISVSKAKWAFWGLHDAQFELATQVMPIPYRWRLGECRI